MTNTKDLDAILADATDHEIEELLAADERVRQAADRKAQEELARQARKAAREPHLSRVDQAAARAIGEEFSEQLVDQARKRYPAAVVEQFANKTYSGSLAEGWAQYVDDLERANRDYQDKQSKAKKSDPKSYATEAEVAAAFASGDLPAEAMRRWYKGERGGTKSSKPAAEDFDSEEAAAQAFIDGQIDQSDLASLYARHHWRH